MNENIDLTKILKDCPKGWKFYSDICGKVVFDHIDNVDNINSKIIVVFNNYISIGFTKEGYCCTDDIGGKCILFPSKEQRDWSKFTAPWYKKEELVKPKFKVGDKIVNVPMKYWGASVTQGIISKITEDKYIFSDGSYMSISNQDSWELVPDKKSKFDPNTLRPFDKVLVSIDGEWQCDFFSHILSGGIFNKRCMGIGDMNVVIPYNDDTKHLVGTTGEAPKFYRYWDD